MKLKGTYSSDATYDVGDVVVFTDGKVYHLQNPCKAGTPPVNTRYWGMVDQTLAEATLIVMDAMEIEEGDDIELADNLTTETSGKALDAKQGSVLKEYVDAKVEKDDVVNDLAQTEEGKVLDARQGKALKDTIDGYFPDDMTLVLASSTAESAKKFAITVDDDGELTATEIVEETPSEGE